MESNLSAFLGVVLAAIATVSFAQTPSTTAPGGGDIDSVPQHAMWIPAATCSRHAALMAESSGPADS
jgi:hypothetical protein